jgi:hypothetical protein
MSGCVKLDAFVSLAPQFEQRAFAIPDTGEIMIPQMGAQHAFLLHWRKLERELRNDTLIVAVWIS